jgi:thiamine monophosphate synthase
MMAKTAPVPVIAIGGIGVDQVATVIEEGASGIAVISAILDAPDPGRAAAELRSILNQHQLRI